MENIKLACSCGILAPLSLEACFQKLAQAGFPGVEIPVMGFIPPAQTSPERRREILAAARRESVAIVGVHGTLPREGHRFTSPDPEERRRSLSFLKAVIDLVADLEGQVVTVGSPAARNIPPGVSREEGWAWAREFFGEAARYAEPRGVKVALEIINRYETNIGVTLEEGARLIQEVGLPSFGLTADTYHMNIDEGPFRQVLGEYAPHIMHMHVSDGNRQVPGQGNLDFHAIVGALLDAQWCGYLSLELMTDYFGQPLKEPVERALLLSRQYLEGVLAQECAKRGIITR